MPNIKSVSKWFAMLDPLECLNEYDAPSAEDLLKIKKKIKMSIRLEKKSLKTCEILFRFLRFGEDLKSDFKIAPSVTALK